MNKKILFFLTAIAAAASICMDARGQQTASDPLYLNENAPIESRIKDLLSRMTPDEKIDLLRASSPANERLGIAKYYHGNEALHGVVRPGCFTVFPQAIALSASWDPELLHTVATAISDEARGRWNELEQGKEQKDKFSDLLTFWSPTVNMARDPRWGRTPETYGEDPYLTGRMGVAFVTGLQGDDPRYLKVVSTPKHFAANNVESNRMSAESTISEKDLREYYLAPYEACVKEGHAQSIMASYNAINGIPSSCNPWLLTKVLREDWGFDGYVVSDCGGVYNIFAEHNFVSRPETAATLSIKAGLDLECGDAVFDYPLRQAYRMGMVTDEDLDRAAGRVLTARMKLGIFDSFESNPYNKISPDVVGCDKHHDLALKIAQESMVLLKNNGALPLNAKKIKKISVVGFSADKCLFGDYSGNPVNAAISPLEGIKSKLAPGTEVYTAPWISLDSNYSLITPEEGFKAEYFHGDSLEGTPAVRSEKYLLYDPFNLPPDPFLPEAPMSSRWEGEVVAPASGEYVFRLTSDDGCRLFIDDNLVIDDWTSHSSKTYEAKINLDAGSKHNIKVEYFDGGESCIAKLEWSIPQPPHDTSFNNYGSEMARNIKESDVVIAVMGIDKTIEREGRDRKDLNLPDDQIQFIRDLYSVNKNVILVLEVGASTSVVWEQENLPAILLAWYPGEQGGKAIADILFGDCNPSGKLPMTFYKDTDDLPPMDDYDITKRTYKYFEGDVLYPFGYGLSYTSFKYSNIEIKDCGETYDVSLKVRNTGRRDGDQVVKVFVRLPEYEGKAPIKELKAFRRVSVPKGGSAEIHVPVRKSDLRYWSESKSCFVYPEGTPEFMVE